MYHINMLFPLVMKIAHTTTVIKIKMMQLGAILSSCSFYLGRVII